MDDFGRKTVMNILSEKSQIDENYIKETDNLSDDLNLDSMDLLDVEVSIEEAFYKRVSIVDKINTSTSVGDLMKLLETQI